MITAISQFVKDPDILLRLYRRALTEAVGLDKCFVPSSCCMVNGLVTVIVDPAHETASDEEYENTDGGREPYQMSLFDE